MKLRVTNGTLLLLCVTLTEGFAPLQISNLNKAGCNLNKGSFKSNHDYIKLSTRISSTDESEKTGSLTDQDEELLFGQGVTEKVPFPTPKRHKSRSGNILEPANGTTKMSPLDYSSKDPMINKLYSMRNTKLTSCPQLWSELVKICPEKRALFDERHGDDNVDLTFAQVKDLVEKSASVFQKLGVKKGSKLAILGENSAQWLLVDHGIQLAGGVSAVRGADAPLDELRYIYNHSQSAGIVVLQGPKLLEKLAKDAQKKGLKGLGLQNESNGHVRAIVLMHREKKSNEDITQMIQHLELDDLDVNVFADLLEQASPISKQSTPKIVSDDLATIVYTSGTTGSPKGVMLSHGNLLHQVSHRLSPSQQYDEAEPLPGELMISLLPVWHITERTFELWLLSRGGHIVYSNIRHFKKDLATHQPQWMVLVPRVLEKVASGVQGKFASGSTVAKALVKFFTFTGRIKCRNEKIARGLIIGKDEAGALKELKARLIVSALKPINFIGDKVVWSKVKDGFGGKIKIIISGGSALSGSLETFYETCGINIVVGYGLTECSPLISFRRNDRNLITGGCVGLPCYDTELRVVDPEIKAEDIVGERSALRDGEIGVVIARGPQIMKGYYKNPESTAKAIDKFGFFDTGDLGMINPATGDLILTGRCKDTIVLSNGENIEPGPIEDAILGNSPLIEQIMLTGQDGRSLVAILVLNPLELVLSGFIDEATGKIMQKNNELINDPKCTQEDCERATLVLKEISSKLRKDTTLKKDILANVKMATSSFRQWEQVGNVYITLEPFAMANGFLTQSYKVKRDAVFSRYSNEL